MACPGCHTVSCYICRQIIVGYDHFSNVGDQFALFLKGYLGGPARVPYQWLQFD